MQDTKQHRHRWALLISLLLLIVVGLLQWSEVLGDGGITMVASYVLLGLSGLISLGWLVLGSGFSAPCRFGIPVTLLALLAIASQFVHLQGWRGDMSPVLRVGAEQGKDLDGAGSGRRIILGPPSPSDSPVFLGHGRDGWSDLLVETNWDELPPQELWRRDIGEGWSSFSVVSGVAFTQEQRGPDQAVTAYDLLTGELLWIHAWPGALKSNLGGPGPRSTPTVSQGRVYAIGPLGKLICLDGATGEVNWALDLPGGYGVDLDADSSAIAFGRANSPIVHGGLVIAPVGGRVEDPPPGLVAFDAVTGEKVWESPGRNVSYATPVVTTLAGLEQIVAVHESSVAGHDLKSGALLWEHPWPGGTSSNASCSDPVPIGPDRLLLSKGYGIGSALLRLTQSDRGIAVTEEWAAVRSLQTKFTNVVMFDSLAVGLSDGILMGTDISSGARAWKKGRYGHGQILGVGDLLLVISEAGVLRLIDPSRSGAGEVLAELQALQGKTWNQPSLAGQVLLLRNANEVAAYRLPVRAGSH